MSRPTKVMLGDQEYLLAPMNLAVMEQYQELITEMTKPNFNIVGRANEFAELLHVALQRKSPDILLADVKREVDMGNMADMINALFSASGFVAAEGEARPGKVSTN